uniref:Uncharacterized protein n=1 Tax=Pantoea phage Survivor TaxID=3232176 RepID=A0AAU8L0X5_9CAUD
MPKITINLNGSVHKQPSVEIDVKDIVWISGKTNRPGCTVTLTLGRVLKSTDDSTELRKAMDAAKAADDTPQRG